jgi:hypothetical protein
MMSAYATAVPAACRNALPPEVASTDRERGNGVTTLGPCLTPLGRMLRGSGAVLSGCEGGNGREETKRRTLRTHHEGVLVKLAEIGQGFFDFAVLDVSSRPKGARKSSK